jgi:hypothetical protein
MKTLAWALMTSVWAAIMTFGGLHEASEGARAFAAGVLIVLFVITCAVTLLE